MSQPEPLTEQRLDEIETRAARPRALHLLEAADFLRDAHFRDGLSVQEAITALRNMADEADPMVGSLARDGFGLDEIAAMSAAPDQALRDRVAEALKGVRVWRTLDGCDGWEYAGAEVLTDALAAVLPCDERSGVLLWAADKLDAHATQLANVSDDPAAPVAKVGIRAATEWRVAAALLRRLAAGERDEQQAQQDGAETATTADRAEALGMTPTEYRAHCHRTAEEQIRTAARGLYADAGFRVIDALDEQPAAAPVAGQPPADTGEEARSDVGTEFVRQVDRPDEAGIAAFEADLASKGRPKADSNTGTEETVHGCPPDGSGLTPCCGRTPFELPLTDRISSEVPVTCPGKEA